MSNDLQRFHRLVHMGIPRFEYFRLEQGKRVRGAHLTDVVLDDVPTVLLPDDEEVLGQFICYGQASVAITNDGRPSKLALTETFSIVTAFQGAA